MAKTDKKPPSDRECCNCRRVIGDEVRGIQVDDDSGQRSWCPVCFIFHRAPMEPGRWNAAAPVKCSSCGVESICFGVLGCRPCGSPTVLILVPAGALATA